MNLKTFLLIFCLLFLSSVFFPFSAQAFRFVSWADAQDNLLSSPNLPATSRQVATLNPAFAIFAGDFEEQGFSIAGAGQMAKEMNGDLSGQTTNHLFEKTFLVRGNHDNRNRDSDENWQNYFATLNRPFPTGVTNYVGLNSTSTFLTYSFDYENSRFIGVDVPGNTDLITDTQITFLDQRLTDAENKKLAHVFLFWHGPLYCVREDHCSCSDPTENCTPSIITSLLNKHCLGGKTIVSATFHGHEHVLGWTHLSNGQDGAATRIPSLSCPQEQFMTSPCGKFPNSSGVYPNRLDYFNPVDLQGFATIDVHGKSFTVNLYRVGTTASVWSKTFTKQIENSADANLDQKVNALDFSIWSSHSGQPLSGPALGDFNHTGEVNQTDIAYWSTRYNLSH